MTSLVALLLAAELLDALAIPRRRRDLRSVGLRLLPTLCAFGAALAAVGSVEAAALITIAGAAALTVGSNLKFRVLGEPLLFSDFVVAASFVRHPRFYLDAVPPLVRLTATTAAGCLLLVAIAGYVPRPAPHLAGLAICLVAAAALPSFVYGPWGRAFMPHPGHARDVARHGLVLALLVYWLRWRAQPDVGQHGARPAPRPAAELVIVVQCESFCDPAELLPSAPRLEGLARARRLAWQWGCLQVSGFGAYTMRTEYGVLFGRNEATLGFRRYDPFLTARREAASAMPARLVREGYRTVFVHPHDLRFYERRSLMPAIGFQRVIGREAFGPPSEATGPYVSDHALGMAVQRLVAEASEPTLIYAVTMENHGPWRADRLPGRPGAVDAYVRHLQNSDALLHQLIDTLAADGRPAVLAFFGDHRPSIPGAVEASGERHTPYVLLRFDGPNTVAVPGPGRVDQTPAQLHDAIVACYSVGSASDASHGAPGRASAAAL